MAYLVLVRHGQSKYNEQNRFTGWKDVPLSKLGVEEARNAAKKLSGFKFDVAYTSVLQRAIKTLDIIMKEIMHPSIPVYRDKALNERDYGDLIGMNKDDARKKFGEEHVHIWRRSYDVRPPGGESLKDTAERALPYFNKRILADLKKGKNVIVSAHGNSLRAIIMKLDKLTTGQVLKLEIPTGVPIIYEFNPKGNVVSKKVL